MADRECVSREEFENLKSEVDHIKIEINKSMELLQAIDKKVDVISQRLVSAEKIENLRLDPMQKEIAEIKDNNKWLWRTMVGAIITIAAKIIFDLNK